MSLESGRYFETIGWMSADLRRSKGNKDPVKFSRRYLDANNVTYAVSHLSFHPVLYFSIYPFTLPSRMPGSTNCSFHQFHTGIPAAFAHTPLGVEITRGLQGIAKKYDLDHQFGVAPQDYHLSSVPFPSNASLLSLVANQVGFFFFNSPSGSFLGRCDRVCSITMNKVLPIGLAQGNNRSQIPNIIITNSGSLRFDLFKGSFTKNDQLIA